jgi:hypothetical protein
MNSVPLLLSFLLKIVSGWVHRRQLIVIEFLQAVNRMQMAPSLRKAEAVGRKALRELATIVSPDTLMQ